PYHLHPLASTDTAPTHNQPLSLHDALPISPTIFCSAMPICKKFSGTASSTNDSRVELPKSPSRATICLFSFARAANLCPNASRILFVSSLRIKGTFFQCIHCLLIFLFCRNI